MALRKVTIKRIGSKRTVKTKFGDKESIGIQIKEFDGWINGFVNSITDKWRVDDTIEVDIKKVERDGNTYYNFKTPSNKATKEDIIALEDRIRKLELEVSLLKNRLGISGQNQTEQINENGENLPF